MEAAKIGEKLKSLREKQGISQEEIAKKLNISQNTYSRLETGETEITLKRLEDIAKVYEMQVADLLNLESKVIINQTTGETKGENGIETNKNNIFLGDNASNSVNNNYLERERSLSDQQIKYLKEEVDFLRGMVEHLKNMMEKG